MSEKGIQISSEPFTNSDNEKKRSLRVAYDKIAAVAEAGVDDRREGKEEEGADHGAEKVEWAGFVEEGEFLEVSFAFVFYLA